LFHDLPDDVLTAQAIEIRPLEGLQEFSSVELREQDARAVLVLSAMSNPTEDSSYTLQMHWSMVIVFLKYPT
jgi:hypothetical protein